MNAHPTNAKQAAVRPHQAAAMLGISRSLLYQLLAQNRLESIKIGRARLIKVSSIDALLSE